MASRSLARVKLEAKLEIINAIRRDLDERAEDIVRALKRMDEKAEVPKEALATEKQVSYALDLAKRAGKEISVEELRRMTRFQASRLIDELLSSLATRGEG